MSDAIAISAVTRTLANKLDLYLGHFFPDENTPIVSAKPLDKVDTSGDLINIYLYHISINSSWRNNNIPWKVNPGEVGRPPLPLNLYYLLTAYSAEEAGEVLEGDLRGSHRLLGMAMSILHDIPILTAEHLNEQLELAGSTAFRFAEKEKVRITLHPLSLDDLSKIWTGFQASYRLAVAYEVSVVLLESKLPQPSPLPVLSRGSGDRGPHVIPELFPTITEIRNQSGNRYGYEVGDRIEIDGTGLRGDTVNILFTHPAFDEPTILQPASESNATRLIVDLDPAQPWAAGVCIIQIEIVNDSEPFKRTINKMPIPLSSKISNVSSPVNRAPDQKATVTLDCNPPVQKNQQVALLIAGKEVPPDEKFPATNLTFAFEMNDEEVAKMPDKGFVVRLRVDGVDSIPVILEESDEVPSRSIMIFDPAQKVIVQ